MYTRYGVFFTPQGLLAEGGAAWLGWDLARGGKVSHPDIAGIDVAAITARPRKYGLHGTIKPPFVLADDTSAEALEIALTTLCGTLGPIEMPGLELKMLGRFVALTPQGDPAALDKLAGRVVTSLDGFRASSSQAETLRHPVSALSPVQQQHVRDWGYPYVLDQFRFHITLTDRLTALQRQDVFDALSIYIAPFLPVPFQVDALTLVGQGNDGMFHEIRRFALGG